MFLVSINFLSISFLIFRFIVRRELYIGMCMSVVLIINIVVFLFFLVIKRILKFLIYYNE